MHLCSFDALFDFIQHVLFVSLFTFLSPTSFFFFFMEALNQYWLEDGPLFTILPLKKSISVKNQRDQLIVVAQNYYFTISHQVSRMPQWSHFNPKICGSKYIFYIYLHMCDQLY